MKKHLFFASLGLLVGASSLHAQMFTETSVLAPADPADAADAAADEPVPTKIEIPTGAEVETAPLTGDETGDDLFPEGVPIPDSAFLEEEKAVDVKPKRGRADVLRETIRIRELVAKFSNDPAVAEYKKVADLAQTPEGRRTAMRNYYTALYGKVSKAAPDLAAVVELTLYKKLLSMEQTRVRPTVLIEPIKPLPRSRAADHAPVVEVVTVETVPAAPARIPTGPNDQRPPQEEPAQLESF